MVGFVGFSLIYSVWLNCFQDIVKLTPNEPHNF